MKTTVCRIVALVAVASMPLLGVAAGGTNTLTHMTTRQKVDYAKQLRDAGCLGAAFDALREAIEDLLPKGPAVAPVIRVDARPANPVKGQAYRFGKDPNTHTYFGGNVWSATLLHWSEEERSSINPMRSMRIREKGNHEDEQK